MNKTDALNPFLIKGYSSIHFCDREEEVQRIISAMKNQRNLLLMSLRRMGKSGLILHALQHSEMKKQADSFYIDIFSTTCLNDFVKTLSKEIIGKLDRFPDKILRKASTFFSNIRPVFSLDPITGVPQLQITLVDENRPGDSLDEIFSYLKHSDKPVVIAIDEFQQIANYPEKNIEALLRTHIQQLNHVHFIFSGSRKHLLQEMFTSYSRPFYQSSEILMLEAINREKYIRFAEKNLKAGGKTISKEATALVYDTLLGHTWYIQYVFNKLYTSPSSTIDEKVVWQQIETILLENESIYFNYRNLLTTVQWELLIAIAKEKKMKEPGSKAFSQKYKFSPSTAKTALSALIDKEMVYRSDDGFYYVYDRFLSMWLDYKYR